MTGEERDVVVTVHLVLDEATWGEVDSVIRTQGWQQEEGLRILLGYGAAVHLDPPEQGPPPCFGGPPRGARHPAVPGVPGG